MARSGSVSAAWSICLSQMGHRWGLGQVAHFFENPIDTAKGLTCEALTHKLYLYLVDEVTGKPVEADGYPIVITDPRACCEKVLPLFRLNHTAHLCCQPPP